MANEVLLSTLKYLSNWYSQSNIEEVAINKAGEVWLRLRGKRETPWVMEYDKNLSKQYLIDIMNIIANIMGLGNAATPLGLKAMKSMQKKK